MATRYRIKLPTKDPAAQAADKIIDRIRKLSALAHDQDGTPEGDTAARMADKLMREHAVSLADLSAAERASTDPVKRASYDLGTDEMWARSRIYILGLHLSVTVLYTPGTTRAVLYGHSSAIPVLEFLYCSVNVQLEMALDDWCDEIKAQTGRKPKKGRRTDWQYTANTALHGRLKRMREDNDREAPHTTALVHSRKGEVEQWMADKGIQVGKGRSQRRRTEWIDNAADAAKHVRLNTGIGGPTGPASRTGIGTGAAGLLDG